MVNVGGIILIGIRDWESDNNNNTEEISGIGKIGAMATPTKTKLPQYDLLEVYSDSDKDNLCCDNIISMADITSIGSIGSNSISESSLINDIQFATQEQIDAEIFLKNKDSTSVSRIEMDNTFIDVDDI